MQAWIERLFQIPAAEQRNTLLALLYIFFSASTCVVGRTTADSLFLARIGGEHLAVMYLVSSLVVAAAALVYSKAAERLPLGRLLIATHLSLAFLVAGLRLAPETGADDLFVAPVYLVSEIQGAMTAILFATLLNELFHGRHIGSIFGLAGIGSTLAGIVFGTLLAFVSDDLHVVNLLVMMIVLHLFAIVPILLLKPTRADARSDSALLPGDSESRLANGQTAQEGDNSITRPGLLSNPLIRGVILLAGVKFLVIVLVGFQWKIAVIESFAGSEDAMASYFGAYYAGANVVTAVLQLVVAGRFLRRFGVLPALLAFPTALIIAATAIVNASHVAVVLWAATISKGSETLRRSLTDPAFQMLYGPLPVAVRRRTIVLIGGVIKPLVEALAALTLLELTFLSGAHDISYAVSGLVLVWMVLAVRCARRFQETQMLAASAGE